jgi:iron complex transport system permease protein
MSLAFPAADRRAPALLGALSLACLLVATIGLLHGAIAIPADRLLASLLGSSGIPMGPGLEPFEWAAFRDLRAPRVLLAMLVGAALAQAGAAMQGVFRNPLADPGLVGVASGAALAAVASIVLGAALWPDHFTDTSVGAFATPMASFAGGAGAAWLALQLARSGGYTHVATLLLAGLALNAVAGAGIGLLTQLASDAGLRAATFWLFGSLGKSGWPELAFGGPLLLLVLIVLPTQARKLNALLLGEAEAQHLGIDVEALKRRTLLLIVISVAVSVALAGVIGFIGLIVPHLIRMAAGPDHRLLLPASALGGASLLVIADLVARTCIAPQELPVGILTALVGGPFFLVLLLRYRGRVETW